MSSSSSALQVAVQEGCHLIAMTNAYLFVGLCTRLLCTYFYHYVSSDVRDWTKKIESGQKNCSVSETGQFFLAGQKNEKLTSQRDWPKVHGRPLYIVNFFTFYSLRFPQIQRIGVSPQRTLTDANSQQCNWAWGHGMKKWGNKKWKTTKHFCVCACELLQEHNFQSDFCDMQSAPLQPIQLLQWHSRIQWSLWMCKKEKKKM